MSKRVSITLGTILLGCFFANIAFAFSDVTASSKNYEAIQYLKINNIISGYADGTFRPTQAVTRAEFLKILVGSLKISTPDSTPSGFTDIDESAWYAPYVRTAKQSGWISGYNDNTFKPAQFVTKAEAVKIISMAEKWALPSGYYAQPFIDTPLTEWYTPYIFKAKQQNFLEEAGRFFSPSAQMNRGQVSEILFRINITLANKSQTYSAAFLKDLNLEEPASPSLPALKEYSSQDILNLGYKTSPSNFFEGMNLNADFPNVFFQNEIYYFEGTLASAGKKVFLFLAPENTTDQEKYLNFVGEFTGNKFRIPVIFNQSGKFRMGIIPGESGESKVIDINVLPGIPKAAAAGNSAVPSAPQITYANGQTSVSWTNNGSAFNRITFTQGAVSTYFLCRQNKENITVDYTKFQSFKTGEVSLKVEGAKTNPLKPYELTTSFASGSATKFQAANHTYSNLDETAISIAGFPNTKNSVDKITFSGTAKININVEAAIIRPDGKVDTTMLTTPAALKHINNDDAIPAGSSFTFSYLPVTNGTYSIEINNLDGQAVLNMPVYLKNGIPLIPNYFDLHQGDPPVKNYDLASYRSQLLKLINEERTKAGLKTVVLDTVLNTLAQNHTDDMAARAFFGHFNPDGQSPDDRRIAAKIPSEVGENLANAPDIYFTHYGLMQSAVHRKNILEPKWTKVGIGLTKDADGYYLTAEEFSSNPLSESDLANIEQNIINKVNQARSDLSMSPLTANSSLKNIAAQWSTIMVSQNFFGFNSPDGQTLSAMISKSGLNQTIQAIILESNNTDTLVNEILNNPESKKSSWKEIGISVKTDKLGSEKATLLFSY